MKVKGPKQLQEEVFQKDLCVGCGACIGLCPYFHSHRGKTAMIFPCTTETGRCYAFCPKVEVDLNELSCALHNEPYSGSPLGHYIRIEAARAGKKVSKGAFQCGGTVSALMAFAIKSGVVDAAVLTDAGGVFGLPRLALNRKDVLECAASKYGAAPTLAGLNRALADGHRRLGFVGTPCQVTALAKMRQNPLARPDFSDPASLVVGLFCTWALDARRLEDMLGRKLGGRAVDRMDIPPPPSEVMIIESNGKKMEIPLAQVRPLVPAGCGLCPDMTSEWADLSVGVVEGRTGLNTLVIRTGRGDRLVKQAVKEGFLAIEKLPEKNLEHLAAACASTCRWG